MSRLERLRSLVTQRMNAAADDIGRILEGKVAEYEEEVRFFREENHSLQHKILQVASKSDVQIVVMDESSPSENQEESPPDDSDEDSASAASSPEEEEEEEDAPPKQTRRGRKSHAKDCERPDTSPSSSDTSPSSSDTEPEAPPRKRRAPQTDETQAKRSRD